MRRIILFTALSIVVITASAQPPELPQKGSGPGKPLSPQDAQKLFKLDDGLRIELVACEPQIESPVAMAFDPDGRLWVVEMRDYPNGPDKGKPPMGRIRVLEDKDGDGFFETATTWADNLLFANGLLLWKDGAIVTMAPKITHLRDSKGAGKADKEDVLYVGFAEQNPQLRVSHPILGLDGWVYCANGLRGGKAVRAGDANAKPIDLSGMDFRFDPVNLDNYEAITGPGQFGNTFDAWGNRFVCDNRHHLRHIVMENRYIKRNPYLAAPALLEDISILEDGPLSSGGKVYPLSKNWTTSSLHEGRFTAACGVFIYHGQLLANGQRKLAGEKSPGGDTHQPANAGRSPYHGAAFTCEPTGNLVHMEILTPKGATFEAKPHKKGVEFLATTDDWFRPVFLTHGPEGAMYVVDMYRAVIEHPDFMPAELKNRPDLWAGKDKGRIWRIVPKDHPTKTPRPNLSKASLAELVKALEHEEPWYRQTAQRLLLEKNDKAMIEPLSKFFETTKSPHAKILAAWMREKIHPLTEGEIRALASFDHPRVLEHCFRIAEPFIARGKEPLEIRNLLKNGNDPRVQFQMALAYSAIVRNDKLNDPFGTADLSLGGSLLGYAITAKADRWHRLAVLTRPQQDIILLKSLGAALGKGSPGGGAHKEFHANPNGAYNLSALAPFVREAAIVVASRKPGDERQQESLFGLFVGELSVGNDNEWYFLAGMAEGFSRRGMSLATVVSEVPEGERNNYLRALKSIFNAAAKEARNSKKPVAERLLCLQVISQSPWSTAREALLPLVTDEPTVELRIAALRALAAQQDKEVPALLIKLWPSASPSVRREILEAMLRQPGRVNVLLDEIEAKRLKSSELDPLRTKQLMNHTNAAIKERAKKLLANNLPADRAKVLMEYQAALTLKGDPKNGREVFKKECAICHRVAGFGVDVGPDIADTRTKTLGAMLNDILVPNAAIDANYVNYVVATKDGRILTGMMALETASSITLKRAENQTDVVLRKDVDEIASTGISLMPEGLEKNINVQQMADVLSFLKNWRYLDGTVPLGK